MNRSIIDIKTLDTIYSIFEAKRAKIQRTKSTLIKIRNNISLSNRELRQIANIFLD